MQPVRMQSPLRYKIDVYFACSFNSDDEEKEWKILF